MPCSLPVGSQFEPMSQRPLDDHEVRTPRQFATQAVPRYQDECDVLHMLSFVPVRANDGRQGHAASQIGAFSAAPLAACPLDAVLCAFLVCLFFHLRVELILVDDKPFMSAL